MASASGMVTIVCGPPAAGKSTYVREHMEPGDLVVDLDALYRALGYLPARERHAPLDRYVLTARKAVERALVTDIARRRPIPRSWVIRTMPDGPTREMLSRMLGAAPVVMIPTPAAVCYERIEADPARLEHADKQRLWVDDWWERYTPSRWDVIVETWPHS